MSEVELAKRGDPVEQKHWPNLKAHFPLYEQFWQLHILTLRDNNGQIRGDIDERLELMAQEHYKCFVSLSNALDGVNNTQHSERTFSSLQNAANSAQNVIHFFDRIRTACVPDADRVAGDDLRDFAMGICSYRNFVHEDMVAMVERGGKIFIPKADKLNCYKRWSSLRLAPDADLVLQAQPRIISDNGPQFIAKDFKEFIRISGMTHVRTSPYYPQSNGKLERWHQSLKSECIRPGVPLTPEDARRLIERYVVHYNTVRLHSAIGYVTPLDMLTGRQAQIHAARDRKLEHARRQRQLRRQQAA